MMRRTAIHLTAMVTWFGPHAVADATVHIHIDLNTQRMHVESDSGAEYDWAVSTGRPGHDTPMGVFHPQAMYTMVHSAKYNNAPMPHSIFFTGPYAIHGTGAVGELGHVASHGCVRLAPGNAAKLFAMVKHEGATIVINDAPDTSDAVAANPHRAGHRLAFAQRQRFLDRELGYTSRHHSRGLPAWALDPLGG